MTKPSFQGVRLKDDGLRRTNTREEASIRRTTTRKGRRSASGYDYDDDDWPQQVG